MQVFWADDDRVYTERNSTTFGLLKEITAYSVFIGGLDNITRIRIDPMKTPGKVKIRDISINQSGYETIHSGAWNKFENLKGLNQIQNTFIQGQYLKVDIQGDDGQLLLEISPTSKPGFPIIHIFNLILISGLVLIIFRIIDRLDSDLKFVPYLLVIPLVLTIVMAVISNYAVHPDEQVHFSAVNYYSENTLPPAIDDPAIADTFSVYGKSRLSSYELYYQVAGYFTRLLKPLRLPELTDARLFNNLLFFILIVYSFRNREFRFFTLPILITAQAWYLFSYTNSDAFALFMVIFMAYQASVKTSYLNRFLIDEKPSNATIKYILLGVFLGALLLLKTNYLLFLMFLSLYLIWKIFNNDFNNLKRLVSRLGIIVLIALALPGLRYSLDVRENGFETFEKFEQMTEVKATYPYKPSTPYSKKYANLYLKDRGITLDQLIQNKRWGSNTLITSFGSFGFTQFNPSQTQYNFIKLVSTLLFLTILISVLINAPRHFHVLLGITLFSAVTVVGVSLWASWTINYQPQGRYLAPILAMVGVLYYHIHPFLFKRIFYSLIALLFLSSLHTYIFVGLRYLDKVSFA